MKYLPFERMIYATHLSDEEVAAALSDVVEPETMRFFKKDSSKEYEGFVYSSHFKINRIIRNRNSFLPQISGTIQKTYDGSLVHVKMQLQGFVLAFVIFWCLFVMFFLAAFILSADHSYENILLPMSMLAGIYLMVMIGFKSESRKSRKFFEQLLQAKMASEK